MVEARFTGGGCRSGPLCSGVVVEARGVRSCQYGAGTPELQKLAEEYHGLSAELKAEIKDVGRSATAAHRNGGVSFGTLARDLGRMRVRFALAARSDQVENAREPHRRLTALTVKEVSSDVVSDKVGALARRANFCNDLDAQRRCARVACPPCASLRKIEGVSWCWVRSQFRANDAGVRHNDCPALDDVDDGEEASYMPSCFIARVCLRGGRGKLCTGSQSGLTRALRSVFGQTAKTLLIWRSCSCGSPSSTTLVPAMRSLLRWLVSCIRRVRSGVLWLASSA